MAASAHTARRSRGEGANIQKKKKPQRKLDKGKARASVQDLGNVQAGPSHDDGPSASSGVWESEEWPWVSITDASPSKQAPVFTKDGRYELPAFTIYFFNIVGSSVKVYSAATGLVVSSLSSGTSGSHQDIITSAILSPHNAFQLITGSLDGCIKTWNFIDAVLLQTLNVEHPVHFIAAHQQFKDCLFVSTAKRQYARGKGKASLSDDGLILRISTKPTLETANRDIQNSSEIALVGKTRLPHGFSMSPSGAWLVAIAGHKAYVASTADLKAGFTKFVSPEALTCLAFHPFDEYFATGDDKGVVRLWYCLDKDLTTQTVVGVEKRAPTTTLHWHAHAVSALAFTSNGAYLLSGGEESVLVIWQIHTGKKEFVPRVGAPIMNISIPRSRPEEYLLGLTDASFVFVGAETLKITRSFSRIKFDSSQNPSDSTPLAVHSLSATVILPSSHPSSLQTYSLSKSKLIAELEIAPSNRVSRREEKVLEPSRVVCAIVSHSGEWMATVDTRAGDDSFRGEAYLKMWRWEEASSSWVLNTRVNRPHGLTKITSISFSPEPIGLLVTTGQDGSIKMWRLRSIQSKKKDSSESFWVLRSTVAFRDEIPNHASWSPDGSLLAVSLGPFVAFYDPSSSCLVRVLAIRETCPMVTSAHFLGAGGRYLAVVGKRDVVLWDLVVQRAQWLYRSEAPIYAAISHPHEERLAVLERGQPTTDPDIRATFVSIFDAYTIAPSKRVTVPFLLRAAVWYPPSQSHEPTSFSLLGITSKNCAVLFGDEAQLPTDTGVSTGALVDSSAGAQKASLFRDIFGVSAFTDNSTAPVATFYPVMSSSARRTTETILDVPAYLSPPVGSLYNVLLESFLQRRLPEDNLAAESASQPIKEIGIVDESMDVGQETQLSGRGFVDEEEIGSFVELFRQIAVESPLAYHHAASLRSTHASFGAAPPTSSRPKHRDKGKSIPQPTPQESYPSPESTPSLTAVPPTVGRKRRKSQAS
ncbi:WD40-repeat-containing domain protein [Vararia minispora EC-137]|uniref:WD40-repeat-containing domain protein n=1 Tax=Vararia minispora EC-137 TaxID=1314806 RepID=A0ACB8QIE1_9AGAM|nr:WD40-repeat-containing domain protein [Vararia minispora EC-137]